MTWLFDGTEQQAAPQVPLADYGFCRGICVFELFRVYNNVPFRMEAHLQRLENGARTLGIPLPFSRAELEGQVAHLLAAHPYAHSAVKMYLTAGVPAVSSGLSLGATDGLAPHLYAMVDEVKPKHPLAPYGLEAYQRGMKLRTVPHIRELPSVKTANYGIAFYAARQVAGAAFDDVLFTTPDGYVTEATRANFFAVINGRLLTPARGMLHGITRSVVLELAAKLGLDAAEADLTPADIEHASEAFTCGSIAELVPAGSINGAAMATTMDGPVFSALRKAFTELVAAECPATMPAAAA